VPDTGKLVFFPWLTLPSSVRVGGFRFVPVKTGDPGSVVGGDVAGTAERIFSGYVDIRGKPIDTCTVALRIRHQKAWDVPETLWPKLFQATRCLALAAMSEQRFFRQLDPHINATVFRPIIQGIEPNQSHLNIFVKRRGGGLKMSGFKLNEAIFQLPMEAIETTCPEPSAQLCRALDSARTNETNAWEAIRESLPFFLLGHSETDNLPDESCVMLSALAFERLLDLTASQRNAGNVAEAFAKLWGPHATRTLGQAKRITADPHPKYSKEQSGWPIHRKWMKELYEARSSEVHGRQLPIFSRNWHAWQHIIIAAFAYPLSVKLLLAAEKSYQLSDKELDHCYAIDALLDSDWGSGCRRPPEWPDILSDIENRRALQRTLENALAVS